jgi:succinate dehydrogenase hydrophobic anchor subunit
MKPFSTTACLLKKQSCGSRDEVSSCVLLICLFFIVTLNYYSLPCLWTKEFWRREQERMKPGWQRFVALLFAVSSTAHWSLSSSEIYMDTVEINTPVGATMSYIRVWYSRHICSTISSFSRWCYPHHSIPCLRASVSSLSRLLSAT